MTTPRINGLSYVDRATGEPVRRYEHPHPGSMIHVDVKKLGNIPDGGGWRYVRRQQGNQNRAATPNKPRNKRHQPNLGHAPIHTVTDEYSRVAYAEIHDDETAVTAAAVLARSTRPSRTSSTVKDCSPSQLRCGCGGILSGPSCFPGGA